MRARYRLVLALVVLLALAPLPVASEAARTPTVQAGQLWLLVLEPTAAFAPGFDEPAWVAQPGEWYSVILEEEGWFLAVWELDLPEKVVWIQVDERVQLVSIPQAAPEPAPPPIAPTPTASPTPTRTPTPPPPPTPRPTEVPISCSTPAIAAMPTSITGPGSIAVTANGFAPLSTVNWTGIGAPLGGAWNPPTTTSVADALCVAVDEMAIAADTPGGVWTIRASGIGYYGQAVELSVSFVVRAPILRPTATPPPPPPPTPLPWPTARPPAPSDSDLSVQITSIDTLLSRSFPTVNGRACNRATRWKATGIRIEFAFYNTGLLPTLDSGSHYISEVGSGECRSFTASLIALSPWRTIVIDRVSWTWELER